MVTNDRQRRIFLRVLIGLAVGFAVSAIAIFVAWSEIGTTGDLRIRQMITQRTLRDVDEAIQSYRDMNHALPALLSDLKGLKDAYLPFDDNGDIVDSWDRPFIYSRDGTSYVAISYGRDGAPGGVGLDCDLSTSMPDPPEALPTFHQFLFELPTEGIIGSCVFCGVLAVVLTLILVKPPELTLRGMIAVTPRIIVTIIGALMLSAVISVLHIPSGH